MSKPFHPDDMVYDHDGEFVLEDTLENTIQNRERSPLPHNPPPGPKWQAKQGMARLCLNGAEYSVLACLLDRASKSKGACYPSQGFICKWTFRPERTVERAVAGLRSRKRIAVIELARIYGVPVEKAMAAWRKSAELKVKSGAVNKSASVGEIPPRWNFTASDGKVDRDRDMEERITVVSITPAPKANGCVLFTVTQNTGTVLTFEMTEAAATTLKDAIVSALA